MVRGGGCWSLWGGIEGFDEAWGGGGGGGKDRW